MAASFPAVFPISFQDVVTGQLNSTLENTTLTSSGSLVAVGQIDEQNESTTLTSSGSLVITGSLSAVSDDTTSLSSADLIIVGSVNNQLRDDTLNADASAIIRGDINADLLPDTLDATALAIIRGDLDLTLDSTTLEGLGFTTLQQKAIMSNLSIKKRSLAEVQKSLSDYLPGGVLWEGARIPGTNLNALIAGLSGILLDVEIFNQIYNSEFIPSSEGLNFLENWEKVLVIPDGCFPGPQESDREIRRLHVLVKLASLGVQTSDDFIRLAEILGFPGTEVKSGIDGGIAEPEGQFTIIVNFQFVGNEFPLIFPLPFGSDQFNILECLFLKLKPANCKIIFGLI